MGAITVQAFGRPAMAPPPSRRHRHEPKTGPQDATQALLSSPSTGAPVSPLDTRHPLGEEAENGLFVCENCGKHFNRLCDLNKHAKTHSRPHKCPETSCKYHTYGWPTEKELERHHNDKHSPSPRTFSCLVTGCAYQSKRESNCKQHMEKTHGWNYVRSRACKAYRCTYPGCSECQSPEETADKHIQPAADERAGHADNAARTAATTTAKPAMGPPGAVYWGGLGIPGVPGVPGATVPRSPFAPNAATSQITSDDHQPDPHPAMGAKGQQSQLFAAPAPNVMSDFVLFPGLDSNMLVPGEHGFLDHQEESIHCVPWSSPSTRLRHTKTALREFSESYISAGSHNAGESNGLIVDPVLVQTRLTGSPFDGHHHRISGSPASAPPTSSRQFFPDPAPNSGIRESCSSASLLPTPVPPWNRHASLSLCGDKPARAGAKSDIAGAICRGPAPHTGQKRGIGSVSRGGDGLGKEEGEGEGGSDDDDDEFDFDDGDGDVGSDDDDSDEEPRGKKPKFSPNDDFDDGKMPCPFRLAHPTVYQRERNSKFSPCYTSHAQISTLVRHMARVAHQIQVNKRNISSFDVAPAGDIAHPKAGLCRSCWRKFTDRREFDAHKTQNCTKVSRSKREKFRDLFDTFCVSERDGGGPAVMCGDPPQQLPPRPAVPPAQHKDRRHEGPTPVANAADARDEGRSIWPNNLAALSERVKALEESNKVLKMVATVTMLLLTPQQEQQQQQPNNLAAAASPAADQAASRHGRGHVSSHPRRTRGRAGGGGGLEVSTDSTHTTDQESLVGGMERDAVVDVNHKALSDECDLIRATQRTHSGLSSSSSRSVPTRGGQPAMRAVFETRQHDGLASHEDVDGAPVYATAAGVDGRYATSDLATLPSLVQSPEKPKPNVPPSDSGFISVSSRRLSGAGAGPGTENAPGHQPAPAPTGAASIIEDEAEAEYELEGKIRPAQEPPQPLWGRPYDSQGSQPPPVVESYAADALNAYDAVSEYTMNVDGLDLD